MATVSYEDFSKVDLRTGKIIQVEDFPAARKPAYKVKVDFGPEVGIKWSSVQATNYPKDELVGKTVIGVVNFSPKNIAGFLSEVLLLGVPGEDGKLSLLVPSKPAKVGEKVY